VRLTVPKKEAKIACLSPQLTTEEKMIQREVYDWGVQLSCKPFSGAKTLEIRAEVSLPKASRGSDVKISFSGVTFADPLKLVEAQTWVEAMTALINEARSVVSEMKAARPKKKS